MRNHGPIPDAYTVPDFVADEETKARHATVVRELVNGAVTRGLNALREEHAALYRELATAARRAEREQQRTEREAHAARSRYARVVPKARTASGVVRPPTLFFDDLLSMGAASKLYDATVATAKASRAAAEAARGAFALLERFASKGDAEITLRELDIRRFFKTAEGRRELDEDPRLRELVAQCAAIDAERIAYADRVARGDVGDDERRDRTMAQEGMRFLDGDVRGLHGLRDRDVTFGELRYFAFRDRAGRLWLLDHAPDLMLLLHVPFDVIYSNERYLIARAVGEGASPIERTHARLAGPDPRAGLGVDPRLMRALAEFVARERTTV